MSRFKVDAKTGNLLVLNEKTGKWRKERKKTEDKVDYSRGVTFMPDIKPFVANAHKGKAIEITSRSQLARYERSNNLKQAGDFKPGEIMALENRRIEKGKEEAARLARETGLHRIPGSKWA